MRFASAARNAARAPEPVQRPKFSRRTPHGKSGSHTIDTAARTISKSNVDNSVLQVRIRFDGELYRVLRALPNLIGPCELDTAMSVNLPATKTTLP